MTAVLAVVVVLLLGWCLWLTFDRGGLHDKVDAARDDVDKALWDYDAVVDWMHGLSGWLDEAIPPPPPPQPLAVEPPTVPAFDAIVEATIRDAPTEPIEAWRTRFRFEEKR